MSNRKTTPGQRKYKVIWDAISAAKVGAVVEVRVHSSAAATLIQAVSKEKSREMSVRKKVGLTFAGKLIVTRHGPEADGYTKVGFALEWDGRKL